MLDNRNALNHLTLNTYQMLWYHLCMATQTTVKYKVRLLHEGAEELEAATDDGIWECTSAQEVSNLITNKFDEGWVFHTKRPIGDWGWELFFRKKQ